MNELPREGLSMDIIHSYYELTTEHLPCAHLLYQMAHVPVITDEFKNKTAKSY